MIDRAGQVWEVSDDMVALIVRSYVHETTGSTLHLLFFIDRSPPDLCLYPALEALFSGPYPAVRIA